jgi:hypothetical protein
MLKKRPLLTIRVGHRRAETLPSGGILDGMTNACGSLPLLLALMGAAVVPLHADDAIRYGRDIRPILSDRCFLCHGPDREQQQAGLRLDSYADATIKRRNGFALVPGDVDASLLWQRIDAHDPDAVMPPLDSGKPQLSDHEKNLIRRWIEDGAVYEDHWAFEPLTAPQPPTVDDPWVRNDIDRFVLHKLQSLDLRPNDDADNATLARRAFLDVTGLPPTTAELDHFLNDDAPDAYERLIDRLLNEEPYVSRHAERLAVPWMDLARYADTSGIHMDAGRTIWPYRDWVLNALRDNMPYDQFVIEQLAGDLLPDRTNEQMVASGFNRCHVTTDEGGAINDEALFEYAVERTNTLGTVFLGLTVNCAQCHDHKYDPVSQEEYYALLGFFNNNEEPGLYAQAPDPYRALEPKYTIKTEADAARIAELEAHVASLIAHRDQPDPNEAQALAAFDLSLQDSGWTWTTPTVVTAVSSHGSTLEIQDNGSVLATSPAPTNDDYTIVLGTDRTDLRAITMDVLQHPSLPHGRVGRGGNGNAIMSGISAEIVSRTDPTQRRDLNLIWAWTDHEQPNEDFRIVNALTPDNGRMWALNAHLEPDDRVAMFVSQESFGFEGGSDLIITLNFHSQYAGHSVGNVRFHVSSATEEALATLPTAHTNWYIVGPFQPEGKDANVYDTAFGPEEAPLNFAASYADQQWRYAPAVIEGQNVTLAAIIGAEYVAREFFAPTKRSIDLSLGSDDGIQVYLNGEIVHERRVNRGVAPDQDALTVELQPGRNTYVTKIVNTGGPGGIYYSEAMPEGQLSGDMLAWLLPEPSVTDAFAQRARVAWRMKHSPRYLELTQGITVAQGDIDTLNASMPITMVMQERSEVRPSYVMMRGAYDAPDMERQVARGVPAVLGTLDREGTPTRTDLATWLVDDKNPLTARVTVNRFWAELFGQGIVDTVEDFGLQGTWPSHRELLDWLAATFRDNEWNVRDTMRTMLLSSTYRQASDGNADQDATLYARFPRQRLPAEHIRDQALHISGLLVEHFGGPSVKPYQPGGLWREVAMPSSNTRIFEQGMGDALWRRSVYTYWKRASPPPAMLTLDAPTREYCSARRINTNTPLQALVLWNDIQFVEAARATAARVLLETPEADRLTDLYRRCTGTTPSPGIQLAMQDTLDRFADRYTGDPEAAAALCGVGDAPVPEGVATTDLAAWTMLVNAVLSTDAAIVKD